MIYAVEVRSKVLVDKIEQFEVEADSIEEAKAMYNTGAWLDEYVHSEDTQYSEITGVWDETGNKVY